MTNTVVESENVRIDEFVDKNGERKKEPKEYNRFFYVREGEPDTLPKHQTKS